MPHKVLRKNHYAPRAGSAMREMNMTPLIDVLLVLLIMMILAMPVKFHVTEVDLPNGTPPPFAVKDTNVVAINAQDQLFWNGNPVSPTQLRIQVAAANARPDKPTLRFAPDAQASYDSSAKTIALMKMEGTTSLAFVGNEQYREFES